ncbi:MAG: tetratricopeptide repeat protein [Streptosporangiaceae bacterium]|nr:tetratricopeptide repeat protein [Streptosporangiaceae bacterium]
MGRRTDQRAWAWRSQITQVAGDQHVYPPGSRPAPRPPAALPAAPERLVGRDGEIQELLELLDPRREAPTVVVMAGLPGVGKTALALHAAHEAVSVRNWFPGGALFANLRGYDPDGQLTAGQALDELLRQLAVADADLPPAGERIARYQSELAYLADAGKPVLLVADDVSIAAQVEALVPARGEHRLLVTSRDMLATIPARLINLDVMRPAAATGLITQVLIQARPDDRRSRDESAALQQVAELCGRLPLALQITAEILKADPGLPVTAMAAELRDASTRLARLSRGDGGDRPGAVRAAFEASCRRLTAEQARLFRLLALNPGPDVATAAVGALAGVPAGQVRPLLAALARTSLVTEQPVGGNRWQMHDLIRLYAGELASDASRQDEARAALGRLFEHYLDTAAAANAYFQAVPGQAVSARFDGRGDALAWLDIERPALVAAVALAAAAGHARTAVSLASCLVAFLDWRRHFDDMIMTGQAAADAARRGRDRQGELTALSILGGALERMRRFEEAVAAHQQALTISRELGDQHREAGALNDLGLALHGVRRFEEAIAAHQQALTISRELGDRHREAAALCTLGNDLAELRRFEEAVAAHRQAAGITGKLGDRLAEARALEALGNDLEHARRFEEAIAAHQQALTIYRELSDQHGEGTALNDLGVDLKEVRRFREAIAAHQRACELLAETGDQHGEAAALTNLGNDLVDVRRFKEAVTAHQQAADISRKLGDRHGEAMALGNLGAALVDVRRFKEAVTAHQQAADISRKLGDRYREAIALRNLANTLGRMGRFEEGITACQQAVGIYRELGDRYGAATALNDHGVTLRRMGRFDEATTACRRAATLYAETGDRNGERTALNNLRLALRGVRRFDMKTIWYLLMRKERKPDPPGKAVGGSAGST